MMRIDAAIAAKKVLRCFGIKLIELKVLLALDNFYTGQRNRGSYSAAATAQGTIATSNINQAVRQGKLQFNATTVTSGLML